MVSAFAKRWRAIANAAGAPEAVWNRDSRSGGITESRLAGADYADLAKQAAHSDPETPRRRSTAAITSTRPARLGGSAQISGRRL